MNFKQMDSIVSSLDLVDTRLIEQIPYLYQDFWEIQSNVKHMHELLVQHTKVDNSMLILDLCCGKGASLIELIKKIRCKGIGVDINPNFIGDAKIEAFQHQVSALVNFVEQDIAQYIKQAEQKFDLIIYPSVSDILGNTTESLNLLENLLKDDGVILFEASYKSFNFDLGTGDEKDLDIEDMIINSKFHAELKHVWNNSDISGQLSDDLDKLRKRADEIAQRKPELSYELNAFISEKKNLIKSYQDNELSKATWLLTKAKY